VIFSRLLVEAVCSARPAAALPGSDARVSGRDERPARDALAWLWAYDSQTVPIPGCRTVARVEENAGALGHGPLTPAELAEIEKLMGRSATR
jgi:aryl-alcohol dehydrogenase-like predicted oxidoreductase